MKRVFFSFIFLLVFFIGYGQPIPKRAPSDIDYKLMMKKLSYKDLSEIKLPPERPDFDPWFLFQPGVSRFFDPIYDMRNTPWLTSVKTQSSGGCWAYSAMGSVESRWLMLNMGEYDLSDNNLKYCHRYIPERSTNGNHWMASAYFARRSGPLLEEEDPYPGGTPNPGECPSGINPVYYITDSRYPPSDMNTIKQTVLDFGATWSLLYWNNTYFNSGDNTYYYGGSHQVNHAGCVVGWDDTKVTAGGTGAWIVKNTWGTGWGENGFYYISYNDSQFLQYNGYWPNVMENETNTTIYQYDEIGGYWGVGFNDPVGYGMAKFTGIQKDNEIVKVGTFVVSAGMGIEIKIYENFSGTLSNLLGSMDEVICELPGYYTFDLDSAINIPASNDFYVQIKYNSYSQDNLWPVAVEDTIGGYAMPEIETGKCWINPNAETWPSAWYQIGHNTPYHYDLCIKTYARELFKISGNIMYANSENTPLVSTTVYLKNSQECVIDSTISDGIGFYEFDMVSRGDYQIEIIPAIAWGGANATDALAVELHAIQMPGFILEGLPLIAADVNNNGPINATDALYIKQRAISIITSFPAGDWAVDDNIVTVSNSDVEKNISVLCFGDVNGSYIPE